MIVAVYAGVSNDFCKYVDNSIELSSMPYKWILPSYFDKNETKRIKDTKSLISNPNYKDDYIFAIIEENEKYDYVVIDSDMCILQELDKLGVPFILVYPDMLLSENYYFEFLKRDYSDEFIDIYIGKWEDNIAELINYSCKHKIILKVNHFLIDVKDEIDKYKSQNTYDYKEIMSLLKSKKDNKQTRWLYMFDDSYIGLLQIDFNNTKHKDMIYNIGKSSKYLNRVKPVWIDQCMLRHISAYPGLFKIVKNEKEITLFLENYQNILNKKHIEIDNKLKASYERMFDEEGKLIEELIPFEELQKIIHEKRKEE